MRTRGPEKLSSEYISVSPFVVEVTNIENFIQDTVYDCLNRILYAFDEEMVKGVRDVLELQL